MELVLIALGISRDIALQVIPLFQRLTAEKRDPTDEEITWLKSLQTTEETEFNSDMPPAK